MLDKSIISLTVRFFCENVFITFVISISPGDDTVTVSAGSTLHQTISLNHNCGMGGGMIVVATGHNMTLLTKMLY